MAARARPRQAPAAQSGKAGDDVSRKLMVENIRDATGASEEEVLHMLIECNNDMNETTSRLIDSTSPPPARLPCVRAGRRLSGGCRAQTRTARSRARRTGRKRWARQPQEVGCSASLQELQPH